MIKTMKASYLFMPGMVLLLFNFACSQQDTSSEIAVVPGAPVEVGHISAGTLTDFVTLNAVSAYLQKSYVKANITGYVQSVAILQGQQVAPRQLLFSLITKEARAIGNAVNQLDPAFKFSGISNIRADQPGFVAMVNHQKGDYVQEGEALATISNQRSLVFLLDMPYELHQLVALNKNLELTLPDGEKLNGTVRGTLPSVDSASQTERIIIGVNPLKSLPEGLIAQVKVIKLARPNAMVLPKSAVLANETEDEFWVMKMINDSTAVKVPVKRGIENDKQVEILSPVFNAGDRIIITGNYGIPDTAKVKVVKKL